MNLNEKYSIVEMKREGYKMYEQIGSHEIWTKGQTRILIDSRNREVISMATPIIKEEDK